MSTRKISKVGIYSFAMTIPKEIIKKLRWRERQKVEVLRKGRSIVIKDKKYIYLFLGISIFHLANLYHNWWAPRINFLVSVLTQEVIVNGLILFAIGSFSFLLIQYTKENR